MERRPSSGSIASRTAALLAASADAAAPLRPAMQPDPRLAEALRALGLRDARAALTPLYQPAIENTVEGALRLMADSLVELYTASGDPVLRSEVLESLSIAAEMRRQLLGDDISP